MNITTRLRRAWVAFKTQVPNYDEMADRIIGIVQTTTVNTRPSRGRGVPSDTRRRLKRKVHRAVVRELTK